MALILLEVLQAKMIKVALQDALSNLKAHFEGKTLQIIQLCTTVLLRFCVFYTYGVT